MDFDGSSVADYNLAATFFNIRSADVYCFQKQAGLHHVAEKKQLCNSDFALDCSVPRSQFHVLDAEVDWTLDEVLTSHELLINRTLS